MTSASMASRIGAVALCVGLSAAPWIRVLGDCPGPAAPSCGHEAYKSACPCAPTGGYVSCSIHGKTACPDNDGDNVYSDNWECKSGSASKQCLYGTNKPCWKLYPCKWNAETSKCVVDTMTALDQASYVVKKTEDCGSGSGS